MELGMEWGPEESRAGVAVPNAAHWHGGTRWSLGREEADEREVGFALQ